MPILEVKLLEVQIKVSPRSSLAYVILPQTLNSDSDQLMLCFKDEKIGLAFSSMTFGL